MKQLIKETFWARFLYTFVNRKLSCWWSCFSHQGCVC